MSSSKLSLHTHGARVTSMSASACGIVNRARARAAKLLRPASGTGTMNGAATRHGQCTSASIQSIDGIMLAVLGQVAEVLQQLLRNAKSFRCAVFNGARAPTPSVHQSRRTGHGTGERAVGRRGDAAKPVLLTFRENFSSMPECRAATTPARYSYSPRGRAPSVQLPKGEGVETGTVLPSKIESANPTVHTGCAPIPCYRWLPAGRKTLNQPASVSGLKA